MDRAQEFGLVSESNPGREDSAPYRAAVELAAKSQQFNDWEQELASRPDLEEVEGWQHFLANKIKRDTGMEVQWRKEHGDHLHMAKALHQANLVKRIQYYIASDGRSVYGVFDFGSELVSIPGVLHGGAQFMAFDETCGQLAWLVLPGGCVTVQTDIKFCKPFPAGKAKAVITAVVEKVEGRKAVLKAALRDGPAGNVYSEVTMTYVKLSSKYQGTHVHLQLRARL